MKDAIINNPGLTIACILTAVFILFAVLLFAPVKMMLNAITRKDERIDEEDYIVGDFTMPARWPNDSLDREFEQEPRGM